MIQLIKLCIVCCFLFHHTSRTNCIMTLMHLELYAGDASNEVKQWKSPASSCAYALIGTLRHPSVRFFVYFSLNLTLYAQFDHFFFSFLSFPFWNMMSFQSFTRQYLFKITNLDLNFTLWLTLLHDSQLHCVWSPFPFLLSFFIPFNR